MPSGTRGTIGVVRDRRMKIRMMTDDISGIALWPDVHLDFPGSPFEHLFPAEGEVEDVLPISPSLREEIRAWVDEYTASVGARAPLDLEAHDRWGFRMSQELQRELGPDFHVEYHFETSEVRLETKRDRSGP